MHIDNYLLEAIIIFIISLASNALPFLGAPYTLIATYFIIKNGINIENFVIAIVISGLGAALAKTLTYALGFVLRKPLRRNKNIDILSKFSRSRYFKILLFILSVIPLLPFDDYLFIGGGVAKVSILNMLKVSILGKLTKSAVEIPLEVFGIIKISDVLNVGALTLTLIFSIAFIVLGVVLFLIDWETLYLKAKQKYHWINF